MQDQMVAALKFLTDMLAQRTEQWEKVEEELKRTRIELEIISDRLDNRLASVLNLNETIRMLDNENRQLRYKLDHPYTTPKVSDAPVSAATGPTWVPTVTGCVGGKGSYGREGVEGALGPTGPTGPTGSSRDVVTPSVVPGAPGVVGPGTQYSIEFDCNEEDEG